MKHGALPNPTRPCRIPHRTLFGRILVAAVGLGTMMLFAADPAIPVMARSSWDPSGDAPDLAKLKEHQRPIYSIVLHHSQTPNEPAAMERARLRNIRAYHQGERGWGDIAYHYFVGAAGTVYAGREARFAGDSGTQYDLDGRLLICALGDFTERLPDEKTREVLVAFTVAKLREHGLTPDAVVTHRMVAATDCPGDELQKWFEGAGREAIAKAFAASAGKP